MNRSAPRSQVAGFILPETLATFTITAAVLFSLLSGAATLLVVSDRSIHHVETNDHVYQALRAIVRDVSHMMRARWNGEEPQPYIFSGTERSLLFTIEEAEALYGRRKVVALRPRGALDEMSWQEADLPSTATQIADLHFGPARPFGLGSIRLRFAYIAVVKSPPVPTGAVVKQDAAQPAPTSSRVQKEVRYAAWPSKTTLPDAIAIEASDAETSRRILSLRVPVLINADIGCIQTADANAPGGTADPGTTPTPLGSPQADAATPGAQGTPGPAQSVAKASSGSEGFCSQRDQGQRGDPTSPAAAATETSR